MKNFTFSLVCLFLLSLSVIAGENKTNWTAGMEQRKAFIENKSQFDGLNLLPGSPVLFGTERSTSQILFSKQGVTYRFDKIILPTKEELEEIEKNPYLSHAHKERLEKGTHYKTETIQMQWVNANPNVEVVASKKTSDYHSFFVNEKNINHVKGFEKITYKNLYPGIDAEYVFHHVEGIKYSLILHPGADPSQVKIKYTGNANLKIERNGDLKIPTSYGDIIEHAPVTFYASNQSNSISSAFRISGNIVTFSLGNYDRTKTVVIDPWVVSPTLSNSNCVWECEKDQSGNVYLIGGDVPMKLQKYSSAGALQWTYNTPWDTTNGVWLGGLATDFQGNSYICNGVPGAIQKVNTSGGMVWSRNAGSLSSSEYWSITMNCDQTKLIVGGTKGGTFPSTSLKGAIFDISTSDGSLLNTVEVVQNMRSVVIQPPGFPALTTTFPNEVRAISSSRNARYYYLTHDTIGSINQNISMCNSVPVFGRNSTYEFSYKCENWRPLVSDGDGGKAGNGPICAIKANKNFVYTQNGATVHKRSLANGAILASASIPGGVSSVVQYMTPTNYQPSNSGIDLDSCGNVYVGSTNGVYKFDANLSPISSVSTNFNVYDVAVSTNGDVLVAGSTGTNASTSRIGYIRSVNMGACYFNQLICCNANLCPVGPYCTTDPAVNFTPAGTTGGTWSGVGITNASAGTFNPATAGAGTHNITYTLSCGSETIPVTVIGTCAVLTACKNPNGDLTASGGNGPYTWESSSQVQDCSSCFFGMCTPPICNGVTVTVWTSFSTNTTATPPGTYPIRVKDSTGNILVITSAASLPNCAACTMTSTASSAPTTCGSNNGTATANPVNNVGPFTYLWNNAATTATITGLSAGNYSVTVNGATGCSATASVAVASSTPMSVSTTSTTTTCNFENGTATASASANPGPYTYLWSNAATSATITGIGAGNYSVTVTGSGNCTANSTVTVPSSTGISISTTSTNASCGGSNGTATANATSGTGPFTYAWSNGANGATISNAGAGNYTVTVTGSAGCSATSTVSVGQTSGISVSTSSTNASCGNNNGTATATASSGTGAYTYVWSNGANGFSVSNLGAGSYTVTATDATGCTASSVATVSQSNVIGVNVAAVNTTCGSNNGSASANVSTGTGPFSYLWSNGGNTSTISNIGGGNYTVTVTGAGGCTATSTAVVSGSTAMILTSTSTNANCGQSNGSATVSVSGGSGSYTYLWSNGANSATVFNLSSNNYTVQITDSQACTASQTVNVASNSSLSASATGTNISCTSAGSVSISITGGQPAYSYLWSNGATTQNISGLIAGTYTVTVTDFSGCQFITTSTITGSNNMSSSSVINDETCKGYNNGRINMSANGGIPPYSFSWSNAATTQDVSNLSPGVYIVTITDSQGCTTSSSATILSGTEFTIIASQNGTILNSTNAPNYQWYFNGQPIPGATSQTYNYTQSGNYYVVTTTASCTYTSNILELTVGINEVSLFKDIHVFPNPATDLINVAVLLSNPATASVSLHDGIGKIVWTKNINDKSNTVECSIPISAFADGMYFVEVKAGTEIQRVKVAIRH